MDTSTAEAQQAYQKLEIVINKYLSHTHTHTHTHTPIFVSHTHTHTHTNLYVIYAPFSNVN